MKAINWVAEQDLLTAPLLGIKPTLLFVTVRGRNAWHSTWVQNYSGPAALLSSFGEAAQHAQRRRGPGNTFTIAQVPGLALQTAEGPVALVEFHSHNCFGKWDGDRGAQALRLGTPVGTVMRALGPDGYWRGQPPDKHSFISGRADWNTLSSLPPRKPLLLWSSKVVSADKALRWVRKPGNYTRQGVNKVISTFCQLNPEEERNEGESLYWDACKAVIDDQRDAAREKIETIRARLEPLGGDRTPSPDGN